MDLARTIGGPERWARRLTFATLAGVALGVIGPFGSYLNAGAVTRIAYWTGMFWVGTVVLGLAVGFAVRVAAARGLPRLFTAAAATLVACAPLAVLVAFVGRSVWARYTAGLAPLDWYAQTLFFGLPLVLGGLWLEGRWQGRGSGQTTQSGASAAPSDVAESRFSPALRAEALCLQMEDHYVRVHTPHRSELVLMPMRDAVAQIGEVEGLQVHRSWWVRRSAVQTVEADGRAVVLRLSNGLRAPVARNRIAALRENGWLP